MSFSPFLKSSSMFSICVPAFLRWELHQAVKVYDHKRTLSLLLSAPTSHARPLTFAAPSGGGGGDWINPHSS